MSGVNKVILVGNLGRDPEIKNLSEDLKVAKMPLATTEVYKQNNQKREDTEWHNLVMWRGLADIAEKYLSKGSQIYVEGKIKTRSYETEGVKKYITEIVVDNLVMLGKAPQQPQQMTDGNKELSDQDNVVDEQSDETNDDLPF
jgi:single-strand DNA-binding protein